MVHTLKQVQILPMSLDEAWRFFSNPANLNAITPQDLSFRIISELPEKVYAGLIIIYKINLFGTINQGWVTEITESHEPHYFVDEQRFGPYAFWHHKHFMKAVPNGVEVTDLVHYKLPMGWLGDVLGHWWVKRKLDEIFSYRRKKMQELFSGATSNYYNSVS